MDIKVTKSLQSRIHQFDLENLAFGKVFTDHMFVADFDGEKWGNCQIKPVENLSLHPGNLTFHYGQAIFEGMKAFKDNEGNPVLFRPERHAKRINESAKRLCMAEVPEELFIEALHQLVNLEQDWIPRKVGSSLYIRPFMIAMDSFIGVRPSKTYKLIIVTMPVGPYYDQPVRLKVEDKYVRAAVGGVGYAKAAGNYAASLLPDMMAKKQGFDQVMWMDGYEFKYIQEVGTMNIFFVIGDKVITPPLNGAILDGVTRDSVIRILKNAGHAVEEREISIDEILQAHSDNQLNEVFGTGTAAVVIVVKHITYRNVQIDMDIQSFKLAPFAKKTIEQIRSGVLEDQFNWIVPIRARKPVLN